MPTARPPHDLLVAHDFPPMGGGIARVMAAIADRYPAGMLTVSTGSIAGSAGSDVAIHQHVDRVTVPVGRLGTFAGLLGWSRRVAGLGRESRARFAWCDTIRPAAYAAHWAFRRNGLPYGIMVVGNDILTLRAKLLRNRFKRRVMQRILCDAAVFVANSRWTAAQCAALLRELGLDDSAMRVRVIPLGTDPVQWRADPAAATQFRAGRSLPDGRWMLTVARLVDYKGIDTAIRMLARLHQRYPDLRYAVVGRGPDEAALRELAAALGVEDRVHIIGDVTDAELSSAYSMAYVYVGLTRETPLDVEGFGISFAEAAACGVPAIGAKAGGIPDAVVDGETGLLVDPEDTAGIDAAARRLLDDPDLARQMGAAGRARVERYLNWDRVVMEMREIAAELGR